MSSIEHGHASARGKSKSSLVQAILLMAAFAAVLAVVLRVSTHGLPRSISAMFAGEGGVPEGKYRLVDSLTQAAMLERMAGFWQAEPVMLTQGGVFTVSDRMEFKNNGIIWRVLDYRLRTPGADTGVYRHIYDAYVVPFGWAPGGDSVLACDVRILRQARIHGGDTCFGPEDNFVVWNVSIRDDGVGIQGVDYAAFNGFVGEFFAPGAIALIERVYDGRVAGGKAYSVGQHVIDVAAQGSSQRATLQLDLTRCASGMAGFSMYAYAQVAPLVVSSGMVPQTAIDSVYTHLLRADAWARVVDGWRTGGVRAKVTFELLANGTVGYVKVDGVPRSLPMTSRIITENVKAWRFAPDDSRNAGRRHTFSWGY